MTKHEHARALAAAGFNVFPLHDDNKKARIKGWPDEATTSADAIDLWWSLWPNANVGICTTGLLVVDVDVKGIHNGEDTLELLALSDELVLPSTRCHRTSSGGRHLFFKPTVPIANGVHVVGPGVDIRGDRGYVVAPGSVVGDGAYTVERDVPVSLAPDQLVARCKAARPKKTSTSKAPPPTVNADAAAARATRYLKETEGTTLGAGSNTGTYKVVARVKDCGVTPEVALDLMLQHWNEKCSPPWPVDKLRTMVDHAYEYGQEEPGRAAPEVVYEAIMAADAAVADDPDLEIAVAADPIIRDSVVGLNQEYAFLITGAAGNILWEHATHKGKPLVQVLKEQVFHRALRTRPMLTFGGRSRWLSDVWMEHPDRRTYKGTVFAPEQDTGPDWYNYWKGFAYDSYEGDMARAPKAWQRALADWKEHTLLNVCNGNEELNTWLTGWFAHIIQKPWQKPLVACVFQGRKGVGKNAAVERVGALLGEEYSKTVSGKRFLIGNFNGHMEKQLLLILDEVFWAGDKSADGQLKNLITSTSYQIEHKGAEVYTAENMTRIAILSNEDWVVPATADERRYACFMVGDGRRQDRDFFRLMREDMEAGGYQLLLRYLKEFDLSQVDVDAAPTTPALLAQKIEGLDLMDEWWHQCLTDGCLFSLEDQGWRERVLTTTFRASFDAYQRHKGNGYRVSAEKLGKRFIGKHGAAKSVSARHDGKQHQHYDLLSLDKAREQWEGIQGAEIVWPEPL